MMRGWQTFGPAVNALFPALISATELQEQLAAANDAVLLADCSFDLADPEAGARAFAAGHLPGAHYLHLDRDLSGPRRAGDGSPVAGMAQPGSAGNGRHPLPERAAFAQRMAALGVDNHTLVVAYDAQSGMFAARLWWLLRWAGHGRVAVLDGGLPAWRAAGAVLEAGAAQPRPARPFTLRAPLQATLDYAAVRAGLGRPDRLLIDARSPDRFRGENETLDPVGGHIPGALNRFFRDNLDNDGGFKPAGQLRAEWLALLGGATDQPADARVMLCGSGVTACVNLLALHAAGLGDALLYPGSWSEWCTQPGAPVALGD